MKLFTEKLEKERVKECVCVWVGWGEKVPVCVCERERETEREPFFFLSQKIVLRWNQLFHFHSHLRALGSRNSNFIWLCTLTFELWAVSCPWLRSVRCVQDFNEQVRKIKLKIWCYVLYYFINGIEELNITSTFNCYDTIAYIDGSRSVPVIV